MGIQDLGNVSLIRHAYVRRSQQNRGIGSSLISHLASQTTNPVMVGTWAAASWAISFYEKHGFRRVNEVAKDELLRRYWSIPERQIETSVVLTDDKLAARRE